MVIRSGEFAEIKGWMWETERAEVPVPSSASLTSIIRQTRLPYIPLLKSLLSLYTHSHTLIYARTPTLDATMIAATRRWVHSNRKKIAIGAGVIGAGYVAGQYVLGKISEARQRMGEDRIAKEK